MAISAPGEGFFTSDGVLRTDLSGTSGSQQLKTKTTESTDSIADQAAAATAQEITDAAVISVTSRMDVGDTGFDSGVAELVQQAVASALKNRSSSSNQDTSSTQIIVGGTYQNEILASAEKPAEEQPTSPEEPEEVPPGNERGASNGKGKKVGLSAVGGLYQDELIKASNAKKGGAKDVEA